MRQLRLWKLMCISLLMGVVSMGCAAKGTALYVSPRGSDEKGKGTQESPFATLQRARDEIRALKGDLPRGGVTVKVAGGVYQMSKPLELTAEDSGSRRAPITYEALPGAPVRLVGGRVVEGWQQVTDPKILERLDPAVRSKVRQADLKALGVTDYGGVVGGGLEVFFNDEAMTLSRWPNEGFVKIVDVLPIKPIDVRGTKGDGGGQFTYDGDRPQRWVAEKDLWLEGYWFWDWSDGRMKVQSIDTAKRVIALANPEKHSYGYRKGQWYYAYNALCEIDQPGEWYLDRDSGILYFYPPKPIKTGSVVVSVTPSIITLTKTSWVTFRGFLLEACRSTAITASGVANVKIAACTIRNTGYQAVSLSGEDSGVTGCDIYATAHGGLTLSGGDRTTLKPANLYADNNHVHHIGRWWRMYSGGINLNGVGNRATHNLIDNCPHTAIFFGGNDHLMEYNEIHSVCYEANDGGAIYAGRNWTMRGTVIRYNYLHHINGFEGRGCVGVYLDDMYCGTRIFGNVFYKVTRAAMIGGGRDDSIENNIFVDCVPSTHVDSRALGWAKACSDAWVAEMQTKGTCSGIKYTEPPYTKYPGQADILKGTPGAPEGSLIARNVLVGGRWGDFDGKARPCITFRDNLLEGDPLFVDAAHENFQLKPQSPAYKLGFERIPIEKIGLYRDADRATWPVKALVRPLATPPGAVKPTRAGALPVFKVTRITVPVIVDGKVGAGEWSTSDAAHALPIEQGIGGEKVAPRSLAWLGHDGAALYVLVDNTLAGGRRATRGDTWGQDDAVEIAVSNTALGKTAPIIVLRGFPNGNCVSSEEAGASAAIVKRAREGVEYSASEPVAGHWLTEWRIPFAALGIDPVKQSKFACNISVRKPTENLWVEWQGTRAATWQVDCAGLLEIVP